MGATFLGASPHFRRIWGGGKNRPKIWRDFGQLQISIANISGTHQTIDKQKTALSTTIPSRSREKFGELWSTNKRVYAAKCLPTQNEHRTCCACQHNCIRQMAFLGAKFQPTKLSPQSDVQRRAAARWTLPKISSYFSCMRLKEGRRVIRKHRWCP